LCQSQPGAGALVIGSSGEVALSDRGKSSPAAKEWQIQVQVPPRQSRTGTMFPPSQDKVHTLYELAATMTLCLAAGCKRDRKAAPLAIQPLRGCSDNK
jgi:hypothetical protein